MVSRIFYGFETAFSSLLGFLRDIFSATGTYGIVIGTVFAMLAVRFIIYPGLKGGVGASDKASRSRVIDGEFRELE